MEIESFIKAQKCTSAFIKTKPLNVLNLLITTQVTALMLMVIPSLLRSMKVTSSTASFTVVDVVEETGLLVLWSVLLENVIWKSYVIEILQRLNKLLWLMSYLELLS